MKKTTFRTAFIVLILLQLLLVFYYGTQKAGFHEDEYFSYFSPNRSVGFYYVDREWVETDTLMREFAVVPGEGFQFDKVRIFTSWDTHPPLFYDLIHLACSLTPGIFSKWQGIAVNMAGFVIVQILLAAVCFELTGSLCAALFACACYGFLPGAVTGVILIRMYEYLTAAFLLSLLFHIRILRAKDRRSFVIGIAGAALATFLGFLTQYFFVLFLGPAGLFTALYLLLRRRPDDTAPAVNGAASIVPDAGASAAFAGQRDLRKGFREAFVYGFTQAFALGLTVLCYPWSMAHIFGGYRGEDVASDFFNLTNTLDRFSLFGMLLNRYGFAALLFLMIQLTAFLVPLLIVTGRQAKKRGDAADSFLLVLLSGLGYFFLVSKVGLILGLPSFRYVLPLCPLCVLLIVTALNNIPDRFTGIKNPARLRKAFFASAAAMFALAAVKGVAEKDVLFLYREDAEKVAYAKEHSGLPVVIVYNNSTPYNIWRLTNELFEHDRLYYMNPDNFEPIEDETILSADDLLIYVADSATANDMLSLVAECGPGAPRSVTHVFNEDMWNLYELKR